MNYFFSRILSPYRNILGRLKEKEILTDIVESFILLIRELKDDDLNWGQVNTILSSLEHKMWNWKTSEVEEEINFFLKMYLILALIYKELSYFQDNEIDPNWKIKLESAEAHLFDHIDVLIDEDIFLFIDSMRNIMLDLNVSLPLNPDLRDYIEEDKYHDESI